MSEEDPGLGNLLSLSIGSKSLRNNVVGDHGITESHRITEW